MVEEPVISDFLKYFYKTAIKNITAVHTRSDYFLAVVYNYLKQVKYRDVISPMQMYWY